VDYPNVTDIARGVKIINYPSGCPVHFFLDIQNKSLPKWIAIPPLEKEVRLDDKIAQNTSTTNKCESNI
jgi:hypothetical protein